MFFTNKSQCSYTNSPGGIRRGLIWQSSELNKHQYDPRNVIFCNINEFFANSTYAKMYPANIIGSTDNYILVANDASRLGTKNSKYLFYRPFDIQNPVQVHCEAFPYVNGVDALTDELSYYVDIDMYIDPLTCYVGMTDETLRIIEHDRGDGYNKYYEYYNLWQMNQDQIGKNVGYYNKFPGEIFPSGYSGDPSSMLAADRLDYPCCPYRIKGRLFYSDYPYAMASRPATSASGFPFTASNSFFINMMNNYTVPSSSVFQGAETKNNNVTGFYDTFTLPSLTPDQNDFEQVPSSSTNSRNYYMQHGILQNSFNNAFQMLFSPVLYPMTGTTLPDDQTAADYYCHIPQDSEQSGRFNTNLFFRHATPGFISPVIKLPGITSLRVSNPGGVITTTPTYIRKTLFSSVTGSSTANTVRHPYGYTGLESGVPSYLDLSTLGMLPINYSGSAASYQINFHDLKDRNFSGDDSYVDDSTRVGWLQPAIVYHQKYIQNVDVAIAKCNTTNTSGSGSNGFSGRYKFIGFKGSISLFETNVN